VVAATAEKTDVPIYQDGVGTVQALNTVTLRSRVDGELQKLSFEEGQVVHQNDLLAVIDPRPFEVQVAQMEAQQAKDQSTLDNAKHDLDRYETAKEAVPRQQLDTAAALVTQLQAAIKIDQSQIDNAKLQLKYTQIIAPITGVIGLRTVDVGNMIHSSDANGMAVITQIQPIAVVFTLAQDVLPQVQKAMKGGAEVTALAYDSTFTTQLAKGKLLALDNQIDTSSGTFKIKAVFDNTDLALFPNQFVNVRLLVDTRKGVVVVPSQAVQRSPQSTFVDVIKEDKTVEQRNVTPGPTEAGKTIIEKGLEEGEEVATAGLDRLEDGTKVTIQSPETQGGDNGTTKATGTRGRRGGAGSGGTGRNGRGTTSTTGGGGATP
jgi:multidrug efflux system membrane fusion protein